MIKSRKTALTWIHHVIHQAEHGSGDSIVFQKKALLKHLMNIESVLTVHEVCQSSQDRQIILAAQKTAIAFKSRELAHAAISNRQSQSHSLSSGEQLFWHSLQELVETFGKSLLSKPTSDNISNTKE